MTTLSLLLIYCVCIVIASLLGGALPGLVRLTHRRMQFIMSFVGGLMLGVALLHLLPHSLAEQGSIDRLAGWTLAGLLTMFLLIRVFHVHAHEHGDAGDVQDSHRHDHDHEGPCEHSHAHSYERGHEHSHDSAHLGAPSGQHRFSWLGLALGLSLHTLIDGLALGAAVVAEGEGQRTLGLFGFGTFLAVALHKPLDALSITSLMSAGGWRRSDIRLANVIFAMMCPLGALAFAFGLAGLVTAQHIAVGCALAFAAGVFLCISLADLLPEVAFHTHDRVHLTIALLLGVGLAYGIGFLEPEHAHEAHSHHENAGHSHEATEHGHQHPAH